MPIAGYCHQCGEWIYVTAGWACPKGHPAAVVNGWYDTESGVAVAPAMTPGAGGPDAPDAPAPDVSASGTRTGFLIDLLAIFAQTTSYTAALGNDTDMTIVSNPVDAVWGAGKKRAEYTAALKVADADRTVYFWEVLKERSSGLAFGVAEPENYTTAGTKRSGTRKPAVVGPGSASWEWGYGTTRAVVEEVAARHGFGVRVVLTRQAATW